LPRGAQEFHRYFRATGACSETKTEEFVVGKGVVTRWERVRRANHWFDTLYNASVAGYYCNVRLPGQERPPRKFVSLSELAQRAAAKRPGGRPWVDMDQWREMQARQMGR
jgi:hypothetical protein